MPRAKATPGNHTYYVARWCRAGCYDCAGGSEVLWSAKNAQAVAARHHYATHHRTWVDVEMHIEYGERPEEVREHEGR